MLTPLCAALAGPAPHPFSSHRPRNNMRASRSHNNKRGHLIDRALAVLELTLSRMRDENGKIDVVTLWSVSQASERLGTMCNALYWSVQGGLDNLALFLPIHDSINEASGTRTRHWAPAIVRATLITQLTLDLRSIEPDIRDGTTFCTLEDLCTIRSHPCRLQLFDKLVRFTVVLAANFDITLLQPFLNPSLKELFVTVDCDRQPLVGCANVFLSCLPIRCPSLELLCIDGALRWDVQDTLAYTVHDLRRLTDLRLRFPSIVVLHPFQRHTLKKLDMVITSGPVDIAPRSHTLFPFLHTLRLRGEAEQVGRVLELLQLPRLRNCHIEATLFRSLRALADVSTRLSVFRGMRSLKFQYFNTFRKGTLRVMAKDFFALASCFALEKLAIVGHEVGMHDIVWTAPDLERLTANMDFLYRLELHSTSIHRGAPLRAPVCSLVDLKVLGYCPWLSTLIISVDARNVKWFHMPGAHPDGYPPPRPDMQGFVLTGLVLHESSLCGLRGKAMGFITRQWPYARLYPKAEAGEPIRRFCRVYNAHVNNL